MKRSIFSVILLLMFAVQVFGADNYNSDNYNKIQADSIFVVDVEWHKRASTDYEAYITIDLNYVGIMNPSRFALAEQYVWRNWFLPGFEFDNGDYMYYTDADGVEQSVLQLDYYNEIPDIGTIDDCTDNWRCDEGIPNSRIGYYGLPFYIQEVEFVCDVNDRNKGYLAMTSDITQKDVVNLIRPAYEGFPYPNTSIELESIPLGWGMDGGRIVRYESLPVYCYDMDSTDNSRLYFKLRPNPYYRHYNPDVEGSETWEYSDIISSLGSVTNKNSLPFTMDIDFNFTGDFWNYSVTREEQDFMITNFYGTPDDYELDCEIRYNDRIIENVKFSELTTNQQAKINTGESVCYCKPGDSCKEDCSWLTGTGINAIIQCIYPKSPMVTNINEKFNNDFDKAVSMQQQGVILNQIDNIDKKLSTKKFMTKSVIPFFAFLMLLIFYMFELFVIGLVFLGLVPMMFNQFIKGLKDAFDIDDLLKKNHGIKRGKK